MERAYYYLHWAMTERYKDPNNIYLKKILPPKPAYLNRRECQTLQELEAIKEDPEALNMEGLIIRERILGTMNPEVANFIIYRGAIFADYNRFDRCLQLWLYSLNLKRCIFVAVREDLLRFVRVFSQMYHNGLKIPFDALYQVLQVALVELKKNNQSLFNTTEKTMKEGLQNELDDNIHNMLYLLVIATKVLI
jgi:protein fem-1 homolog B